MLIGIKKSSIKNKCRFQPFTQFYLQAPEKEVKATKENFAVITEFDTGKNKTLRIGYSVDLAIGVDGYVYIETLDGADAVRIESMRVSNAYTSGSVVVDVPGKRLRVTTNASGKYKIFAWSE